MFCEKTAKVFVAHRLACGCAFRSPLGHYDCGNDQTDGKCHAESTFTSVMTWRSVLRVENEVLGDPARPASCGVSFLECCGYYTVDINN